MKVSLEVFLENEIIVVNICVNPIIKNFDIPSLFSLHVMQVFEKKMHDALLEDSIERFDKFSFLINLQQRNICIRNLDGRSLNSHVR